MHSSSAERALRRSDALITARQRPPRVPAVGGRYTRSLVPGPLNPGVLGKPQLDVLTRHVDKHSESRGRVRYLSDTERERLLAACRGSAWPRLHLLVLMAITTGARRGELLGLTWRDVDLERAEATLHDTKNGDRRVLVLIPQVVEELHLFKPRDAAESRSLVFRSRLRPSQPYATAKVFDEAVATAGIRDFRFHDCRHCTASYLAQHGASLLEIADTLGHRTLRMVQRYAHLNTDSRRRLIGRVFEGKV